MTEAPRVFAQATKQAEDSMVHDMAIQTTVKASQPEGSIRVIYDRLNLMVGNLESQIPELVERLKPVLSPLEMIAPSAPTNKESKMPESDLAVSLDELSSRLETVNHAILTLRRRVDL